MTRDVRAALVSGGWTGRTPLPLSIAVALFMMRRESLDDGIVDLQIKA